jgi:hypothetical protein
MGKQPATDKEESIGQYQAAQAGLGGELYVQSHVDKPQSLWSTRLCATPLPRFGRVVAIWPSSSAPPKRGSGARAIRDCKGPRSLRFRHTW